MAIRTLGVVGGGQMGGGIAHVAAASGCAVILVDVADALLEKARATIHKNLDREVAKGQNGTQSDANLAAETTGAADFGAADDGGPMTRERA